MTVTSSLWPRQLLTVLPWFLLLDLSGQNKTWAGRYWCSKFSFVWGPCSDDPCAHSLVGPWVGEPPLGGIVKCRRSLRRLRAAYKNWGCCLHAFVSILPAGRIGSPVLCPCFSHLKGELKAKRQKHSVRRVLPVNQARDGSSACPHLYPQPGVGTGGLILLCICGVLLCKG